MLEQVVPDAARKAPIVNLGAVLEASRSIEERATEPFAEDAR